MSFPRKRESRFFEKKEGLDPRDRVGDDTGEDEFRNPKSFIKIGTLLFPTDHERRA